jgi:hypothetical protein
VCNGFSARNDFLAKNLFSASLLIDILKITYNFEFVPKLPTMCLEEDKGQNI